MSLLPFPTVAFVLFFAAAFLVAWVTSGWPVVRKVVLVAAGLFFYWRWDGRVVLLLTAFVALNWATARVIGRFTSPRGRGLVTAAGIVLDVGALGLFKYYGFFTDTLASSLTHLGVHVSPPVLSVVLPVGISFWTFQAVSYLIDVHRGSVQPATLLDVATWLTFFPTITSGPITRAGEFLPQLAGRADAASVRTARAYALITRGLFKKLVVASFIASTITDKTLANPGSYGATTLLVAVYAYAVQIYCDFGGYTDMAIGMAALLGFELPENFNRPYTATSIQDFWSRWHMTLSRWLRDYLFAPIVTRHTASRARVFVGIVGVMLLAGLWHGAAWGFVVFGAIHGTAMAVERLRRERRRRLRRPPPAQSGLRMLARRTVTFHIVCLGWVFFATPSLSAAMALLSGLVTRWHSPVVSVTPLLLVTVVAVFAAQYLPRRWGSRLLARAQLLSPAAQTVAFALASVPVLALAPASVPAFIYYRF